MTVPAARSMIMVSPGGDLRIHTRNAGPFIHTIAMPGASAGDAITNALLAARLIVTALDGPGGLEGAIGAVRAAAGEPPPSPRWELTATDDARTLSLLLDAGWEPLAVIGGEFHLRRRNGATTPF